MTTTKRGQKKAEPVEQAETEPQVTAEPSAEVEPAETAGGEAVTVALEVPTGADEPEVDEDEAASETIDLDDLITRAGSKAVTQEEVTFVQAVRERFGAGGELSEFDRKWLGELAAR